MNCTMSGSSVLHSVSEFAQTHVHWVGDAISSSAALFTFCLQSFPASRSFPMSQLFASAGQSIGVSASALPLPVNIQGWFPLGSTGLISLQSEGLPRVFSNTTIWNTVVTTLKNKNKQVKLILVIYFNLYIQKVSFQYGSSIKIINEIFHTFLPNLLFEIWFAHNLATWCEEPTHWKRYWCWERLKAKGEEGGKGWDGWMASPTQWMSLIKLWKLVMDREVWHAAVHGVAKIWIRLRDSTEKSIYLKNF